MDDPATEAMLWSQASAIIALLGDGALSWLLRSAVDCATVGDEVGGRWMREMHDRVAEIGDRGTPH